MQAYHLVVWLKALEGQVLSLETLVRALSRGDNRRITDEWVMDSWVGDQVGLELVQIDVQCTVETEGRGDG